MTDVNALFEPVYEAVDAAKAQVDAILNPPSPPPPPKPTIQWGIDASNKAQHDSNLPIYDPPDGSGLAWRYYHQPGEALTYPTEYSLRDNDTFVLTGKVKPQNMTMADALTNERFRKQILLPHQMSTGMMASLFQQCPKDRKTRFSVWHEPEDDIKNGAFTQAQLADAWHRARQAQQQVGDHIILSVILMGYDWQKGSGRNPEDYIPADEDFDELCADVYFAGDIGQSVDMIPKAFDPIIATAQKHGKPWGVTETGVGKKVSGQARLDALTLLAQTIKAKGATVGCYFSTGPKGVWSLDPAGSAESEAWKAGMVS